MSRILRDVPQGSSDFLRSLELAWERHAMSTNIVSSLTGFNSAVEALNTVPEDILAEMVRKYRSVL